MKTERWLANGIEGRHVLLGLIAFFGVMLAANSLLVYYAVDTFSGGDRPDPYRSGLDYNEMIAAAERQDALGWQTEITYDDRRERLTLRFADQGETPVAGLDLVATVSRPATNRKDREVTFREIARGIYATDVTLGPGAWVISATSNDPIYRLKRRLFVGDRP